MKILFPTYSYYPAQIGGPSNSIYWLTKELAAQGYNVKVITTNIGVNNTLEYDKWLTIKGVNVIYYKTLIYYLPFSLIYTSIKHLRSSDVIHLNSFFYPASFILAFIASMMGKKIVWSPRGELHPNALIYSKYRKKIVLAFVKKLFRNNIFFHGTCLEEVEFIKNVFGDDVNIIETPNFMELPEKIEGEEKENYFLFLGRIHPIKAIDHLIKACDQSKLFREKNFKLKIAGDFDDEDYGEQLKVLIKKLKLQNHVEFLGHIEGVEKETCLAKAYFSFLPSHSENFGNVVTEALAQGTPVVASKGTPWQILEEEKAGYWIDNKVETLAEVFDRILLLDNEEYERYCINAQILVKEKFDIKEKISTWSNTYLSLAGQRNINHFNEEKEASTDLSIIVLTYNEEKNIVDCIESLANLKANIFVVDSYSTDRTLEILDEYNIRHVQHPFENYSAQRNWSQKNNPFKTEWVLHLDAGERLTPQLVAWLNNNFNSKDESVDGYMFSRKTVFMDKWIKYGGHYPNFHLRLFRVSKGKCEEKVYDQHFVVNGNKRVITKGVDIIDTVCDNLKDFIVGHAKWAVFEAVEVARSASYAGEVNPKIGGNPIEKRRWLKVNLFEKSPLFLRSISYFVYRYFIKFGFLDGTKGLIFHFLQGFWFRFLVDSMIHEFRVKMEDGESLEDIVQAKYGMKMSDFIKEESEVVNEPQENTAG